MDRVFLCTWKHAPRKPFKVRALEGLTVKSFQFFVHLYAKTDEKHVVYKVSYVNPYEQMKKVDLDYEDPMPHPGMILVLSRHPTHSYQDENGKWVLGYPRMIGKYIPD